MPYLSRALILTALVLATPLASAQERKETPPPLGTASFTPPEGNTKLQPLTPANFVTRAAVANMAEIDLSQLALERSADANVRSYATQLLKDHQIAQGKLKSIAGAAKIALPGTVDEDRRKQKEHLKELTGADFDKEYIALMHAGHDETSKLLDAAAKSNELDAPLKTYAAQTLKTVQAHRSQAEKLHSKH